MSIAFPTALYFKLWHIPLMNTLFPSGIPDSLNFSDSMQLVLGVSITTVGWIVVTLLTPPTAEKTLREFLRKSRAGGPGWKKVIENAKTEGDILGFSEGYKWPVPFGIFCAVVGCVSVYSALFATGLFLYGRFFTGCVLSAVSIVSAIVLLASWKTVASEN